MKRLDADEFVVTAWAESASGPGWSNRPLWVLIQRTGTPHYRVVALQPEEQTETIRALYGVSEAAHETLTREAAAILARPKKRGGKR